MGTVVSPKPLALAVATYCLPSSSIMVDRVIRAFRPRTCGEREMAGRMMNFQPLGPRPVNPDVGNKSNCRAMIRMSIRANQKLGKEMMAKDITLTNRSMSPLGRRADSMPIMPMP